MSEQTKLTSPSQIFDNFSSVHCSVTLDYIIKASRSLTQKNVSNHRQIITTSFSYEREIVCMCVALDATFQAEDVNAMLKLVRDSLVDFGGEVVDSNPFLINKRLVLIIVFIVGDLPVRQYGGIDRHRSSTQTIEHATSYQQFLIEEKFMKQNKYSNNNHTHNEMVTSITASKGQVSERSQ